MGLGRPFARIVAVSTSQTTGVTLDLGNSHSRTVLVLSSCPFRARVLHVPRGLIFVDFDFVASPVRIGAAQSHCDTLLFRDDVRYDNNEQRDVQRLSRLHDGVAG